MEEISNINKGYTKSNEIVSDYELYKTKSAEYVKMKLQYANSFNEMYEAAQKKVYRYEYSKGGECLHRGYYSPSIADVFVSGCARGRLYKRIPKHSKYNYEYAFDKEGYMVYTKKYDVSSGDVTSIELLLREPRRTMSFSFHIHNKELESISECYYEKGKLLRYECARMWTPVECDEIDIEEYEYENGCLKSAYVMWWVYNSLTHKRKYNFIRNDDGCIVEYLSENFNNYVSNERENELSVLEPQIALGAHKHIPGLWEGITKERHLSL